MSSIIIAPSLLSANFAEAGLGVALVEEAGADWVHLDVMDGRFVPNLTFGPKMSADLRPRSRLPFDVHLMTLEPERLVPAFIAAGADYLTFHIESCVHAHRLAIEIRKAGVKSGISLVPSSPVMLIEELLPFVDLVLVMTVSPGFGGQSLIPSCLDKVKTLARIRSKRELNFKISVDGGVNRETLPSVIEAGADVVVMGSAFYESANPKDEVAFVRSLRAG